MDILKLKNAPAMACCKKAGLKSSVLYCSSSDSGRENEVVWVEIKPGQSQNPHKHPFEQVIIVIKGGGLMTIEDESANVQKGDRIRVPENQMHGIQNNEQSPLTYLSISKKR